MAIMVVDLGKDGTHFDINFQLLLKKTVELDVPLLMALEKHLVAEAKSWLKGI